MGRACYYANRTVVEMLSIQALDKTRTRCRCGGAVPVRDVTISVNELRFLGTPVRIVDQLLTTEAG